MPERRLIRVLNKILRNRLTSRLFFSQRFSWELTGLTKGLTMEAILRGMGDERRFWRTGEEDARRLLKFVDSSSVVLDVGCGIGRVMRFVAPRCKEIHGVDTSALILRRARTELRDLKNCHFCRYDFAKFDGFPAGSFDLIYSFYTLQHMEKEDAYICLLRIHRLLKPGGVTYIQFPDFVSDHFFALFQKYALMGSRYGARARFYTRPEIEKLFEGAGINLLEYIKENENVFVTGVKSSEH
jgi:ubiquinone/menaquinone biosynthesis C-methylase UbiE